MLTRFLKATSIGVLYLTFAFAVNLNAQSTFGTILGTVRDSSSAVVPNATIKITNADENTSRNVVSDANGDYQALNSKPGRYNVVATAPGFQTFTRANLLLTARQTLRIDVELAVGTATEAVTVDASAGVITTDTQTIASSINSEKLIALPGNVRAANDTSPYNLIAMLPGVQPDNGGNFMIQGSLPSQTQYSLDGISTVNVSGNGPLRKAFTSVEAIAEIKVQGVGNNAEYGQSGDVTTISKSGSNDLHGSAFWYHQNRALDAKRYGALTKPHKVANDAGGSLSGPVILPKIYNGKNKTFFFADFERFTFPRQQTIQNRVPTQAVRNGDFSKESTIVYDPVTNLPFAGNVIPTSRLNPVAVKFLSLYPLPNAGDTSVIRDANYIDNRDSSYNSKQYDIRGDHYLTSTQSIFARWSWLNTDTNTPKNLAVPSGLAKENSKMLTVSHNYTITPSIVNEFRFGFTRFDNDNSMPFDGRAFTKSLGLQGLGDSFPFNGLTHLDINNIQSLNVDRADGFGKAHTLQVTDNLSWTKGRHTMKFGGDIRRMRAASALGFLSGDNYGNFNFDGSFSKVGMGDFLLGLPVTSAYAKLKNDNDGVTTHYAFYAQDSFRVSTKLTLEYGIRYEYHPSYRDRGGNIGNFDPSVPKSGAVIYPTGYESNLSPGQLAGFNACPVLGSREGPSANGAPCTPVLSASQAGIPEGLRYVPKYRFMPRFGFAYRPFGGDKTVIRGGFGMYNVAVLGNVFYSLTGTLQADSRQFINSDASGKPTFAWPNVNAGGTGIVTSTYGNAYFGTANGIRFKDPYSQQWNLSVDRTLGKSTGLRVSYIGMHTLNLVWSPDLNQSYYSKTYYVSQPLSSRTFPNWGVVNTRVTGANAYYNAAQIELTHRMRSGLQFNSTYTWASNLSENNGPAPTGFPGETTSRSADLYNRKAEYGNMYGTRRQRWITTALAELPFGRNRRFLSQSGRAIDAILGGWTLTSSFLLQTGPFMSPTFSTGDPGGTGKTGGHPDRVGDGNLSNPTRTMWADPNAFVCPGTPGWKIGTACTIGVNPSRDLAPIGRPGNAGTGIIVGPGTLNLNAGLSKVFRMTEHLKLRLEGTFTNALNHTNLADPNLNITSSSFGRITSARDADFGGSRTGQVSVRIDF